MKRTPMDYMFDEILQRMVYTTIEEDTDVDKALELAKVFEGLNKQTQEYLLTRLQILMEGDNNE